MKGTSMDVSSSEIKEISNMKRDMEIKILCNNYQPDKALLNIKIDGKSIKGDKALQRDLLSEWQDLLMHLFPQAQKILVESMVPGYSGAGIVAVSPFLEHGTGQKVVVKFGDVQQIKLEHANYLSYVKPFIGGQHGTVVLDYCYMERLGGIAYTFLGTDIDDMQDFGQFYARATTAQIKQALDHLFLRSCRLWYASTSALRPLNLTELYQKQSPSNYSLKKLESAIARSLPTVLGQKTLNMDSLESLSPANFTNPFYALKNAQPFVCSSYTTITHGDLNQNNIFVDRNGYTYLIDFGTTSPSHILRDIAMLDCVIHLDLLSAEDATLDERLNMERVLCNMSRFSDIEQVRDGFSTTNLALMKAFDTVVHLRKLARWMVEKKPEDDIREYFVSLLYNTLETLGFSSPRIEQHEHALLSASLLVDRLDIGNSK